MDEHSIVGRHSGELKIFAIRVLDEIDQFLFNLEKSSSICRVLYQCVLDKLFQIATCDNIRHCFNSRCQAFFKASTISWRFTSLFITGFVFVDPFITNPIKQLLLQTLARWQKIKKTQNKSYSNRMFKLGEITLSSTA